MARKAVPVFEFGKEGPQRFVEVEERPSLVVDGPPMTGTCAGCGIDLDAQARAGKIGHACFGPDDVTNYDPPN